MALTKVANLTYNGRPVYITSTSKVVWATGPNGETVLSSIQTATPAPAPAPAPPPAPAQDNLVFDCSTFNTSNWLSYGGPTISNTLVADPTGKPTAQQITFSKNQADFYQTLNPKLAAGKYTASIYASVQSGSGQAFNLSYWDGATAMTQFSSVFHPTTTWQRFGPFTFTVAAGDVAPSIVIINTATDGGTRPTADTIAIWGLKVEPGTTMTDFNGSAKTATSSTATTKPILGCFIQPFGSPNPTLGQIMASGPKYNLFVGVSLMPNGPQSFIFDGVLPPGDNASTVSTWKASGRAALLQVFDMSPFSLKNSSDETNLFNVLTGYIDQYGFNGIEWDFESGGANFTAQSTINVSTRLKQKYGDSFIVCCAPRHFDLVSSGLITVLKHASCDWGVFQEYDNVVYADASFAQIKYDFADIITTLGVPASKVLVGFAPDPGVSGGGTAPDVAANALKYLVTTYPGFRGAMVWTVRGEANSGWAYHKGLSAALGL